MAKTLYNHFFRLYKCSGISILDGLLFSSESTFNNELRLIFTQALMDINSTSIINIIDKNSDNNSINWSEIKNKIRLSFKQQVVTQNDVNYVISYIITRMPYDTRNQGFIFVQTDQGSSLLLVKTRYSTMSKYFLKWCERQLGRCVIIRPLSLKTPFIRQLIDRHYSQEIIGDLSISFKPEVATLSSIVVEFEAKELKSFGADLTEGLMIYLEKSLAIDLKQLKIGRVNTGNLILMSDSKTNSIMFCNDLNPERVYEILIDVYEEGKMV